MKTSSPRLSSSLARLQPTTPDIENIKREGWQQQLILVVSLHDKRLDFTERQWVRRLGDRLYGRESL